MTDSSHAAAGVVIEEWRPDLTAAADAAADLDMLADVLRAVVYGGAGVSFFVPFSIEEARAFWRDTVQMELSVPPNQRHRADVLKLLVHPSARRRGIARAFMAALEAIARDEGRTLLTLDTVTGSAAELLYRSLGYVVVGVIPRYAR